MGHGQRCNERGAVSGFTFGGDVTAVAPGDYQSVNGLLTFAPGETNKSIVVAVVGDTIYELNETFNVNLFSPSNASFSDSIGLGTILNDDPIPTISIGDATLADKLRDQLASGKFDRALGGKKDRGAIERVDFYGPTSTLVEPQHLARKAIIYIRQSSPHQVLTNQESLRLQYALRDRAVTLGWRAEDIEIIDGDLGLSGAATHYREGFKELLTRVTLGEVGVEPPPELRVELFRAVDIRDGDDDDLELQVDLACPRGP